MNQNVLCLLGMRRQNSCPFCPRAFAERCMVMWRLVLVGLLAVCSSSFPQKRVDEIAKQKISFDAYQTNPAKNRVEPGDTLRFVYKIYTDAEKTTGFVQPEVKLSIRALADNIPSLIFSSFEHLDAYLAIAEQGGRAPKNYPRTIDAAKATVTYALDDFDRYPSRNDPTRMVSDTLVFEFKFRVIDSLRNITCLRLYVGADAHLSSFDVDDASRIEHGPIDATRELDTESILNWNSELDPPPPPGGYQPDAIINLKITYQNTGNVRDVIRYKIAFPPGIDTSHVDFNNLVLPPNARVDFAQTTRDTLVILDSEVLPTEGETTIIIPIKLRITQAQNRFFDFKVILIARCAESRTEEEKFEVALINLISVTKSATPAAVFPGETISYTITVNHERANTVIDTVHVFDFLDDGIVAILEATPPFFRNKNNQELFWKLTDFADPLRTTAQITFKAKVRPDYYNAVARSNACRGVNFFNRVNVVPIQNDPNAIPEGIIGDNDASTVTAIQPLGDVLRLSRVALRDRNNPAQILPGDTLRFAVYFGNVSRFASSQFFTVCDTLPNRNYISAPFDINKTNAVYLPGPNVIRLDSLNFTPGREDSLVFYVRVRDDIRICAEVPLLNKAALKLIDGLDCDLIDNALTSNLTIANPRTETQLALMNLSRNAERDKPTDFTINYNSGTSLIPVREVTITATLASGMEFVSSDLTPTVNGQVLTWSGLSLAPAENKAIRVTVIPRASQPCFADMLRATATISSNPQVCTPAPAQVGALILPGTDDLLDLRVTATPDTATMLDAASAPRLIYTLKIINNSPFDAEELVLTNTLPDAKNFTSVSASPGSVIDSVAGVITWNIARLNKGDSLKFSVEGNVRNRLYCAPDSLVNTAVLVATKLPLCLPERDVKRHAIAPTRVADQPVLQVVGLASLKPEGRPDGAVEPYEPATVCVMMRASGAMSNMRLQSNVPNFSGWTASFGESVVALVPEASNPTAMAAGQELEFCFRLQGPQTITVANALIRGVIVSDQNCGQTLAPLSFPAKGLPLLELALALTDSTGNNLAIDEEWLTATTTLQHENTSQFNAENVTLHLALRAEAPANIKMISAYDANDIKLAVAQFAVNAPALPWVVKFSYPILKPENQRIIATAYYSYFGFNSAGALAEVKSAEVTALLAVEHPCHARPRTFIPVNSHPGMYHEGMLFQPDDGQTVMIFDVAGNKVWEGQTNNAWDGTNQDKAPVPPGTYVWVITGEGGCKGTIVVLR